MVWGHGYGDTWDGMGTPRHWRQGRSWWSSNGLNRVFILIILGVSPTPTTPHRMFFFLQIYWENAKFQCKKKGLFIHIVTWIQCHHPLTKQTFSDPYPQDFVVPLLACTRAAVSSAGGSTGDTSLSLKLFSAIHSVWPRGRLCWKNSVTLFHLLSFTLLWSSLSKILRKKKKYFPRDQGRPRLDKSD